MSSVEEFYRGKAVRVFRLDREGSLKRLQDCARDLLKARSDVEEVWLFGSMARNDARPGSDADLLIVLSDSSDGFLDRTPSLARHFDGVGVGCDILAYTESELAQLTNENRRFLEVVHSEGVLLARRVED